MVEVTAGLVLFAGRILLAQRPSGKRLAGKWEFPGGKLEAGEDLKACLRRELAEELQLDVKVGKKYGETCHRYDFGDLCLHVYWVLPADDKFVLREHQAAVWVSPQELKDYDFAAADLEIVARLQAEFKDFFVEK